MTLKMTTAQVVETSVTVTNSSFQNYNHPDDHTTRTFYGFVTYKRCIQVVHGPAIHRTRDPNNEGDGGPTNVKARVAVFKTLWKFLRIISVIITKLMK